MRDLVAPSLERVNPEIGSFTYDFKYFFLEGLRDGSGALCPFNTRLVSALRHLGPDFRLGCPGDASQLMRCIFQKLKEEGVDTSFAEIQLNQTILCGRCCQESASGRRSNIIQHSMDVSLSNTNNSDAFTLQELVVSNMEPEVVERSCDSEHCIGHNRRGTMTAVESMLENLRVTLDQEEVATLVAILEFHQNLDSTREAAVEYLMDLLQDGRVKKNKRQVKGAVLKAVRAHSYQSFRIEATRDTGNFTRVVCPHSQIRQRGLFATKDFRNRDDTSCPSHPS